MGRKSKEPQKNNLLNYFSKGNKTGIKREKTVKKSKNLVIDDDGEIEFVCEVKKEEKSEYFDLESDSPLTKILPKPKCNDTLSLQLADGDKAVSGDLLDGNENETQVETETDSQILDCLQIEFDKEREDQPDNIISEVCKIEISQTLSSPGIVISDVHSEAQQNDSQPTSVQIGAVVGTQLCANIATVFDDGELGLSEVLLETESTSVQIGAVAGTQLITNIANISVDGEVALSERLLKTESTEEARLDLPSSWNLSNRTGTQLLVNGDNAVNNVDNTKIRSSERLVKSESAEAALFDLPNSRTQSRSSTTTPKPQLPYTSLQDLPNFHVSPSVQRNMNKFKSLSNPSPDKLLLPELQDFLSDVKIQTALTRKGSRLSALSHIATPPRSQTGAGNSPAGAEKRALFRSPEKSQNVEIVPQRRRYEVPYYLLNFSTLIESVISDEFYSGLFNEDDLSLAEVFRSLSREAKIAYVRLFNRKNEWKALTGIKLSEDIDVDVIPKALEELVNDRLLLDAADLDALEPALRLLQVSDLEKLCKEFHIKVTKKELRIEAIVAHCKNVKPIFGSRADLEKKILVRCRKTISQCFKLASVPRTTFCRMLALSTMHKMNVDDEENGQKQFFLTMLMTMTGKMVYPEYTILKQSRVFRHRDDLIRYTNCLRVAEAISEAFEKKNYEEVLRITEHCLSEFQQDLKNTSKMEFDSSLPLHLRRYVATSVNVYNLWKRAEALEKQKNYRGAVSVLECLVRQDTYVPYYRGKIYERLALDYQAHLKDNKNLIKTLSVALKDPWVSPSHKYALEQRVLRLFKKKKDPVGAELSDGIVEPKQADEVTLEGKRLENEVGSKSTFMRKEPGGTTLFCSVEEFVITHYQENGYPNGRHAEGSLFTSLFGVVMWDIIYELRIPDAFLGLHQHAPLDLDCSFYENRRNYVDERLELINAWEEKDLRRCFKEVWDKHHGKVSLVNWNLLLSVDYSVDLVLSVGLSVFSRICDRLVKNFRVWRSGFPDLVVWNPTTRKHLIIEVKGPNDRLSPKQILWLEYLNDVGAKAIVCWVKDSSVNTGVRKRKASPSSPQTPPKKFKAKGPKSPRPEKKTESKRAPRSGRKPTDQLSETPTKSQKRGGASGEDTPKKSRKPVARRKLSKNVSSDSDFE